MARTAIPTLLLHALATAALAGGCTSLLGFETPTGPLDGSVADAPRSADAAPHVDARIVDAHLVFDADIHDAVVPDARGNPVSTLVMGQPTIIGLALDLNGIYWSTMDGTIQRANKDGSGPSILASGPASAEGPIQVQNGFVYWVTREFQAPFRLYRASIGGGGAFNRIIGSINSTAGYAVDPSGIIYNTGLDVKHALLDGTMQTTLWPLTTDPFFITRDANNSYWSVFDFTDGHIESIALASGAEKTLATGQTQPLMVLTDGTRVFWPNLGMNDPTGGGLLAHTSSVMSVLTDGTGQAVITSGDSFTRAIAIDGGFVYWYSHDQRAILRRAKDGTGAIATVAVPSASSDVPAIAVDANFVYWATFSTIERASKTVP